MIIDREESLHSRCKLSQDLKASANFFEGCFAREQDGWRDGEFFPGFAVVLRKIFFLTTNHVLHTRLCLNSGFEI